MTPITLYQGCFVKTRGGSIVGPLEANCKDFVCGGLLWLQGGEIFDACFGRAEKDLRAVAVYPSLSAAAAANPEM